MKKLAVITARGGSKRIPRKNVKLFLGKPIIEYSINAAFDSGLFDTVMVSTDDKEIAAVAVEAGAQVPFFRSEKNSNDFAVTADVIMEVLANYETLAQNFDFVCCIYPTAPFVTPKLLNNAFELLIEKMSDGVFPISEFSFPIQRSLNLSDTGKVAFNWPEHELTRSQDLSKAYQDSGQFYFLRVDSFMNNPRLVSGNTYGIPIPNLEVQDIDNEEDWKLAELKYTFLYGNK